MPKNEILVRFSAARGRLRGESKKGPRHANLHDLNIHVPKFHQDRISRARAMFESSKKMANF